MNGIALMISGADFSTANLGRVTILEDVAIESLSITGSSVVEESTAQYSVACAPSTTLQTSVDWSIDSGGEYARIDNSGLLTVFGEILESTVVVIRATSVFNPNVTATKSVTLSSGIAIPVSVAYTSGSRKANANGINTSYTNMATFTNESLLNWTTDTYKVTVDSNYKVYFALVRPTDNKCGVRSDLYGAGEYDVTTIMETIGASLDTTAYTHFALVVVASDYNPYGAQGSTVVPSDIPEHITVEKE